jgi:hypothetical protein
VAPDNISAPTIAGVARVGETLTADDGTWSGVPAPALARQWLRCDPAGAFCTPIAGATGPAFTITADLLQARIRVRVTATNNDGAASKDSDATGLVLPAVQTAGGGGGTTPPAGGTGGAGVIPVVPPGPVMAADTQAPSVALTIAKAKLGAVLRRGLALTVGCSEACRLAVRVTMAAPRRGRSRVLRFALTEAGAVGSLAVKQRAAVIVGSATASRPGAGSARLVVKFTKKARRTLARVRRVALTVAVTATDTAGNAATVQRKTTLRR